jgi:hypothetical protein
MRASPKLQTITIKSRGDKDEMKNNDEEQGEVKKSSYAFVGAINITVIAAAYLAASNKTVYLYPMHDSLRLDSGATIHICTSLARISNYTHVTKSTVLCAGYNLIPIDSFGTVVIKVKPDDNRTKMVIL